MKERTGIFAALSILWVALSILACGVIADERYMPIPPPLTPKVDFDHQVQVARTAAVPNGVLLLTVYEDQLSSQLESKLNTNYADLLFTDNNLDGVKLQIGKVYVIGIVAKSGHPLSSIAINLTANISTEGKPVFTVTSVELAHQLLDLEGLDKTISAFVAESLTEIFSQATAGFSLKNIEIHDGEMIITGQAK